MQIVKNTTILYEPFLLLRYDTVTCINKKIGCLSTSDFQKQTT